MATISLNNSSLKKYLDLFRSFDISSKKRLIEGMNKSIEEQENDEADKISELFGAWDDDRDADAIIIDIKSVRTNNPDIEAF